MTIMQILAWIGEALTISGLVSIALALCFLNGERG
jgi:hypothetical protein